MQDEEVLELKSKLDLENEKSKSLDKSLSESKTSLMSHLLDKVTSPAALSRLIQVSSQKYYLL